MIKPSFCRRAQKLFGALCCMGMLLCPTPALGEDNIYTEGARLIDAWQLEQAIVAAAHGLMVHAEASDARVMAAEVLHQRGQHSQALALLHNIEPTTISPWARHRLEQFLPQLRGSAPYADTFQTRTSKHFRLRFQDKDVIMAFYAEDVLEAAYKRIGADLRAHVAEQGEPITVEIYPNVLGLAQATGLTEQNIESSGTIAVCKFHRLMVISPLATATGYAWADTLAHELTHLMISKKSRNNVPIWLHEGIAKYFETRWRGKAGLGLTPYAETLLARAVRDHQLIAFSRMHPSMAKLPNQHDATLAFAEVFAMVDMLVKQKGVGVIAQALQALAGGMDFDAMTVRYFGGDLPSLERALHQSLAKRSFKTAYAEAATVRLGSQHHSDPSQHFLEGTQQLAQEDNKAKQLLRLGELLALRNHAPQSVEPLQRAYKRVGVRLPRLGLRLAQTLHDAHDDGAAETIIAQTVAAHEDLIEAQKLYAQLLMQRHEPQSAIAHLRAYCLHNPYDASVHMLWADALQELHNNHDEQQERAFAKLASAPRQRATPAPTQQGSALLRVVTEPWGQVQVDGTGEWLPTPAWDVPVAPGHHVLRAYGQVQGRTVRAEDAVEVAPQTPCLWRRALAPAP